MSSLWLAVAWTCLRKDWFGYAFFLVIGIVGYPSFSIQLVVLCLVVLAAIAVVRIALTYLYVRGRIGAIPADRRVNETRDLAKFCDANIRGVFG